MKQEDKNITFENEGNMYPHPPSLAGPHLCYDVVFCRFDYIDFIYHSFMDCVTVISFLESHTSSLTDDFGISVVIWNEEREKETFVGKCAKFTSCKMPFFYTRENSWKRFASVQVAQTAGAYPGSFSIKRLGIFLLPPWKGPPPPSIKFVGIHL